MGDSDICCCDNTAYFEPSTVTILGYTGSVMEMFGSEEAMSAPVSSGAVVVYAQSCVPHKCEGTRISGLDKTRPNE